MCYLAVSAIIIIIIIIIIFVILCTLRGVSFLFCLFCLVFVCIILYWILLAKTAKSRFVQPFGGNVHGISMAHVKARGRLGLIELFR